MKLVERAAPTLPAGLQNPQCWREIVIREQKRNSDLKSGYQLIAKFDKGGMGGGGGGDLWKKQKGMF